MNETGDIICPHCGARMPRDFQFCGRCGRSLLAAPETEAIRHGAVSSTAERRQITVMFCDLVGSVALSRMLDPEDFASIVRRFQKVSVEAIEGQRGFVAQYLGDGILAYFGYPTADERAAEKAVRAGLHILARIAKLNEDLTAEHGSALGVRIGVHTGPVVVDEMGSGTRRERLALGETPNVAARVQSAAPVDSLVVSRETYRLIEEAFRCVDLGPQPLKGVERPRHLYRVVEERQAYGVVDRLRPNAPRPTIGRRTDIATLLDAWSDAVAGNGRAVLISGEPGVGKTHLVDHLRTQIGPESHYSIACRCIPNQEGSAFHPLVDWLSRVLNFYPEQTLDDRLEMLRFVAGQNGLVDHDVVPLLGSLLTKAVLAEISDLDYSASRARERTEAVLEELILGMGADRSLLFIVEDIQWIDPSTRAFIHRFARRAADRPVLLLLTTRASGVIEWPGDLPLTRIDLDRMSSEEIRDVITAAAGGRSLPGPVVERIEEKAEGVPLYAEEFTKMVIETDILVDGETGFTLRDDVPELSIPSTLQDSLMARLDRIMPVKEVAQAGSIFGKSFSFDLLQATTGMSTARLDAALKRLVEAGLLVLEVKRPTRRYTFRHALLQEAAYESTLKSRRSLYHGRVADYLIAQSDTGEVCPETIAYHLAQAGDAERAAAYWCRAGSEAQARWENEEATVHFKRGLALIERLPLSDTLRRIAFDLNVGLAGATLQQKGYTHPDVAAAFERAADLASDLQDAAASMRAVQGLWSYYSVLGDHTRAEVLAERLAKLAPMAAPSVNTLAAVCSRAATWFWQGDIGAARKQLESLLLQLGDLREGPHAGLPLQHPAVGAPSYLALILWCQGYTQRAVKMGREAIQRAQELDHPFSEAFACGFNSLLHAYMNDLDGVRELGARTVDISHRFGFPFWYRAGRVIGAWADRETDPERAVDAMGRELQALKQAGVRIWTAYPTALAAELLGQMGRFEQAMEEFDDVIAECELHGEFYFMPEIRRLRARVLHELGESELAAREREYALSMAKRQTARALTVRILIDILRHATSPSPELVDQLRSEVESFPAGAQSHDLIQARGVLTDASVLRPATNGRA